MDTDKRILDELIISILIMAVCIFAIVVATGYKDPMAEEYPTLRSTFIPILWASFLGGSGFIYFLTLLVRKKRATSTEPVPSKSEQSTEETKNEKSQAHSKRKVLIAVLLTGIALFTYCYLLKKFYFLYLTIGFLFVLLNIYEGIRRWLINLLIAIVGAVSIYALFVIFMQIPL